MTSGPEAKGRALQWAGVRAAGRWQDVLLAGCAFGTLAAALARPGVADAQAFQGTPTVVSGVIKINRTPNNDQITIDRTNSQTGIIDWAPTDTVGTGTINFLPSTGTVDFSNTSPGNYTILNRIFPLNPARKVAFSGVVRSFDGLTPGGNIWFYSPAGIVVTGTAVFDVGGLVLTTDNIDVTGGLVGASGEIRFRGPANSLSDIVINGSAQITASRSGSYVAMVAPRVQNAGTITVNGSAALVAAEQADVTVNAGLFDIKVLAGTTATVGIDESGQIGGPSSTSINDPQNIYLVAVPKNTAGQMLVSGSLGYQPAVVAGVDNGAVVLSAGYDIVGGTTVGTPNGPTTGDITIGNGAVTSSLDARATHNITLTPNVGGAFNASSNVTLWARNSSIAAAPQNAVIDIGGDLAIIARAPGQGGFAELTTTHPAGVGSSANIHVGGRLSIDAQGLGLNSLTGAPGSPGTGGTASLQVNLGSVTVGGGVSIDADGFGGDGANGAGAGTGGQASLLAAGGRLDLGATDVRARGTGGQSVPVGGASIGGRVIVDLSEGPQNETVVASGSLTLRGNNDSGTTSGSIDMITRFHQPGSSIAFTNLTATSSGAPNPNFPGFHLATDGGVLSIGSVTINTPGLASLQALTPVGGGPVGALAVTDALSVTADSIAVDQLAPPGPGPLDTLHAGSVTLTAATGFNSTNNARIGATNNLQIQVTNGGANVASISAGGEARITTTGGVVLGSASGTGANGSVVIDAGLIVGLHSPTANATINGAVNATGSVAITSGGDVVVSNGASVLSDNSVAIKAGDDIIVSGGGLVRAANNPLADPGVLAPDESNTAAFLSLQAGGIPLSSAPLPGPHSIIVDGVIAAPGRPIYLTADAIQADTNAIAARSLFADITNPPAVGVPADQDGGSLRTDCTAGTICLGQLTLSGKLRVGSVLGAGGALPNIVRVQGLTGAKSVSLRARDLVDLGGGTVVSGVVPISASDDMLVQSTLGSVNLRSAVLLSGGATPGAGNGLFRVAAGNNISGAGARMASGTDLNVSAGSSITLAGATATRHVGLFGSSMNIGSSALSAGGSIVMGSAAGLGTGGVLNAGYDPSNLATATPGRTTGVITITTPTISAGRLYIAAGGGLSMKSAATSTAGGGSGRIDVTSGGAITTLDLNAATALSVSGDTDLSARNVQAQTSVNIGAGGGASLNNAFAGTGLTVNAASAISIDTVGAPTASLASTGGAVIVATDLATTAAADVSGTSVSLKSPNGLNLGVVRATTGDIVANSAGVLNLADGLARGDINLTSNLGVVNVTTASTVLGAGALPAGTGAGSGTILVTAGTDANLNGTVTSRSLLDLRAGGTVAVNAAASAPTISLASADVAIGAAASLGQSGLTNAVTLRNTADGVQTSIVGAGAAGHYNLGAAELNRVHSVNLTINGSQSDVTVGALSLTAGATGPIGTAGLLAITGGSGVHVNGAVAIEGLADQGTVDIKAGTALTLNNAAGSIVLHNTAGGLGGSLSLTAPVVVAASPTAVLDVQGAASLADRDARLAINDGAVIDAGVLQARGIQLSASTGIFVQNTGAGTGMDDRRGLTFGQGGLDLTTTAPATQVVLNGRSDLGAGAFAIGPDVLPFLKFNGVTPAPGAVFTNLDLNSTVNGCAVADFITCGALPAAPAPGVQVADLVSAMIGNPLGAFAEPDGVEVADEFAADEEESPDQQAGSSGDEPAASSEEAATAERAPRRTFLIQGTGAGSALPPTIDAPAGVGNDSLWTAEMRPGK